MSANPETKSQTPVYFVSHGGPTVTYDTKHPVYPQLQKLGSEIKHQVRPKAIVAISAHWESEIPNTIQINGAEKTDLIYDFYGFPKHFYTHKFPSLGSPSLASQVQTLLSNANVKSNLTTRGLDHGIFSCFSVIFPPSSPNALFPSIPIVQISLPFTSRSASTEAAKEGAEKCIALGKALTPLREEGVVIVTSGMAVHNLRDLFGGEVGVVKAYARTFDEALKDAVVGSSSKKSQEQNGEGKEERGERMKGLLGRSDARKAHPTWEHLWPIYVAAGAAGEETSVAGKAERLYTLPDGSVSWAMYRFGKVAKEGREESL